MKKINTSNTDPEYWERQLEKFGLGIVQPMTDNSEGEMAEVDQKMRGNMGSNVGHFTPDGLKNYQITKVRKIERKIPEWTLSDKGVQRVLLLAFPNLKTSFKQSKKAGRWARIIHLYYRMKQPSQIVAKELKMKESTLKTTLRNIRRVAKGLTVSGTRRHP